MSNTKTRNCLILIFTMMCSIFSFFFFGCEPERVPVINICFTFEDTSQIVLEVGQSLSLQDYVKVEQSFATDKSYFLRSNDESVVIVNGKSITAMKVGETELVAISNDNNYIQDTIKVVVRDEKENLVSPLNISYHSDSQSISFTKNAFASSYIVKINGAVYNIGNSNTFDLSKINGGFVDRLLDIQVQACATEYSGYESSNFSDVVKIYQQSQIGDYYIKNGILNIAGNYTYNLYIGNDLLEQNREVAMFDFNTLDTGYAGKNLEIGVQAVVPSSIKQSGVLYYDAQRQNAELKVLGAVVPAISNTTLFWKNVGADYYIIKVDGTEIKNSGNVICVTKNSFDLTEWEGYRLLSSDEHKISVIAKVGNGTYNTAETKLTLFVRFKVLDTLQVVANGQKIVWNAIENAISYSYELRYKEDGKDKVVDSATSATEICLSSYKNGTEFNLTIFAEGVSASDCYLLPSKTTTMTFVKQASVNKIIEDYKLKLDTIIGDNYKYEIKDSSNAVIYEQTFEADALKKEIDLTAWKYIPGEVEIAIDHFGDNIRKLDANQETISFAQLQAVDLEIENGKVKIVQQTNGEEINRNADYEIFVTGGGLSADKDVSDGFDLIADAELVAGEYALSVYVVGNGSSTFSYDYKNSLADSVNFLVLTTPTLATDACKVVWNSINGANRYAYTIDINETKQSGTTDKDTTELDLSSYSNGTRFNICVTAIGEDTDEKYVLPSKQANLLVDKQTGVEAKVEGGDLKLTTIVGDNYKFKIVDSKGNVVRDVSFTADKTDYVYEDLELIEFEAGNVDVRIYHYGNSTNKVDSNVDAISFVQLQPANLVITNSKINVEQIDGSTTNANAKYYLKGLNGTKIVEFRPLEIDLTTLELTAKEYNLELYVYGDDSATFGYRRDGNYAVVSTTKFEKLATPIVKVVDPSISRLTIDPNIKAEGFKINSATTNKGETEFDFVLNSGSLDFRVLALGDGVKYINSNETSLKVTRLATPSMSYNKATNVISKIDNNDSALINKTYLTDNGVEYSYNFASPFVKTYYTNDVIELTLIANVGSNGNFYLNSKPTSITITHVDAVTNIYVSKNATTKKHQLNFDAVDKIVGYEIYTFDTNYNKVADVVTTFYDVSNVTNLTKFAVKAISKSEEIDGVYYVDSQFSELVAVKQTATPLVELNDTADAFVIDLVEVWDYIELENVILTVGVKLSFNTENNEAEVKFVDGVCEFYLNKKLIDNIASLDSANKNLIIQAEQIAKYVDLDNAAPFEVQNISLQFNLDYEGIIADTYTYLIDSTTRTATAIGLGSPTPNYSTGDEAYKISKIYWEDFAYNKDLSDNVAFVFSIEYTDSNGDTIEIDSLDRSLVYFEGSEYKTYLAGNISNLTGLNCNFPAGIYDHSINMLTHSFGAGHYEVKIKAVPLSNDNQFMLLASKYSNSISIDILDVPKNIKASSGILSWNLVDKAGYYRLYAYEYSSNNLLFTEKTSTNSFDFGDISLARYNGLMKFVVQADNKTSNILPSEMSDEMVYFRLSSSIDAVIDTDRLLITANKYYESINLLFVDSADRVLGMLTYDNPTFEQDTDEIVEYYNQGQYLTLLNLLQETRTEIITLTNEYLSLLKDKDYYVKVQLVGGTSVILSSSIVKLTNSNTQVQVGKLDTPNVSVNKGVVQITSNYMNKDGETTYKIDKVNVNYIFNNKLAYKNALIYNVKISTDVNFYMLDYYYFKLHEANFDYTALSNYGNLCGYVKFEYESGKNLYFNVFVDNKIDLATSFNVSYYETGCEVNKGSQKIIWSSSPGIKTLDLSNGGIYTLDITMLGGTGYYDETSQLYKAYLSSNVAPLQPIVRYSNSELSVIDGQISLVNLVPLKDNDIIDLPVYRLTFEKSGVSKIVYVYFDSLENARIVASWNDSNLIDDIIYAQAVMYNVNTNSYVYCDSANFVTAVKDIHNLVVYDMSQDFINGTYKVMVQTLAGVGNGSTDARNYLLNSYTIDNYTTYNVLTDTTATINAYDLLNVPFGYYNLDGITEYDSVLEYEVYIKDLTTSQKCKYIINSDSVGVEAFGAYFNYHLPSKVVDVNGNEFSIPSGHEYKIQFRALAHDGLGINARFGSELTVYKSEGVSNVKVSNGILTWKVNNLANYGSVRIKIQQVGSENVQYIDSIVGTAKYEGEYKYHYYDFSTSGVNFIPGQNYNLSMYVIGYGDTKIASDYSQAIIINRLKAVEANSIILTNNVLSWNIVNGADSYLVKFKGTDLEYNVKLSQIDFNLKGILLPVAGTYDITVQALGDNLLNSLVTTSSRQFIVLSSPSNLRLQDVVDEGGLVDTIVCWDAVNNASLYVVKFNFGDGLSETVETETNSCAIPENVEGTYTIEVSARNFDNDYTFSSEKAMLTSTATQEVSALAYDEDNFRFVWTAPENMTAGDKFKLTYTRVGLEDAEDVENYSQTISYQEGVSEYSYYLKTIGNYTIFSIRVLKPSSTPSKVLSVENTSFDLYASGNGENSSPYIIKNCEQAKNIKYFSNKHFKLGADLNIGNVETEQEYLFAENFSGTLDGNKKESENYRIFIQSINLIDVKNFALFKNVNNAIIRNLDFAQWVSINANYTNTTSENVNLALLAVNVGNSSISNINIIKNESGEAMTINISLPNNKYLNGEVNVAGICVNAMQTNISRVNIDKFAVTSKANVTRMAGIVAYTNGNVLSNTVINSCSVVVSIAVANNKLVTYFGGIVAKADYTQLINCSVDGTLSHQNVNSQVCWGGLIGYMDKGYSGTSLFNISGCQSTLVYDIAITEKMNQAIGGVVGWLYVGTMTDTEYIIGGENITGQSTITTSKDTTVIRCFGKEGQDA